MDRIHRVEVTGDGPYRREPLNPPACVPFGGRLLHAKAFSVVMVSVPMVSR
jgi:hypothetical protein